MCRLQDYDFASSKADEAQAAINERERQLRSSDNAQRVSRPRPAPRAAPRPTEV